MCGSPLATLTRLFSLSVIAFGGALIAYAIWFAVKANFGVPSGVALGLGLADLLMGLLILTCGTNKLFALRLFLLVNGLILILDFVICVLFAIPSQQQVIIEKMQLEPSVASWVQEHITVATYILGAACLAKLITMLLVWMQSCKVARDASRLDDDERGPDGKKLSRKEKKERAALLAEERVKQMEEAATSKYREKNADLYSKYSIKK